MPTNPAPVASQFKTTGSLSQLTPIFLRQKYLMGLDFIDNDGQPWPDELYHYHLQTAIDEFERETQVRVLSKVITNEAHDYSAGDYSNFAYLQLFEFPVQSVESVSAIYPTGQTAMVFPPQWVKLYPEHGQIQLVPTQGSLSSVLIGQGGTYLPLVYGGISSLPQLFHVAYTAGFPANAIPWSVFDCICKLAAIQILTVASDTIYPLGASNVSVGIDGLSQGIGIVNNGQLPAIFAGRINLYRKELYGGMGMGDTGQKGRLASISDYYSGLRMMVV